MRGIFSCNAPLQMSALQTLVESPSCPHTVIRLTGHGILALTSDPKAIAFEKDNPTSPFKIATLRGIADKALGIQRDGQSNSPNSPQDMKKKHQ